MSGQTEKTHQTDKNVEREDPTKIKNFQCPVCHLRLATRVELEEHKKKNH